MSSERSSAGRLFQTAGPLTAKLRSPWVVFVRGTANWPVTADLRRDRTRRDVGTQNPTRYDETRPRWNCDCRLHHNSSFVCDPLRTVLVATLRNCSGATQLALHLFFRLRDVRFDVIAAAASAICCCGKKKIIFIEIYWRKYWLYRSTKEVNDEINHVIIRGSADISVALFIWLITAGENRKHTHAEETDRQAKTQIHWVSKSSHL